MNARELAEEMAAKMKSIIEDGQDAIPLCFAHTNRNEILMLPIDLADEHAKDVSAKLIRLIAKFPEINFVIFLTDAWWATIDAKDHVYMDLSGGVKSLPNRQESIVASIYTKDGIPDMGHWIYSRDSQNKPVFSEKMEWVKGDNVSGRFVAGSGGSRDASA